MDVVGLSMFTYSLLGVLGYGALLIGTQVYLAWFKEYEYRTMMILTMVLNIFTAPVNFLLVSRKNLQWGVPDLCLIIGEDSVAGVFS